MTGASLLVYDDGFLEYDFGPRHPFRAERSQLARELLDLTGTLSAGNVRESGASPASEEALTRAHDRGYLEAVRACGADPEGVGRRYLRYGLGTADNPVFAAMYGAAALHAGGTVGAARAVRRGEVDHALTLGGGFHHAHRARASGFCILNDLTVALRALLDDGLDRILYVDVDAHHGDGVAYAFYEDPQVLTVSLHQDGRSLFPGTGFVHEVGEGEGAGYTVHVPLPPGTGDEDYVRAFRTTVLPLAEAFGPELILAQLGADTYHRDPLTDLELTTWGHRAVVRELDDLAHGVAAGRWVATGGGGYVPSAVARAWALAFGVMAGRDLGDALPEGWVDRYRTILGSDPEGDRLVDEPRPSRPAAHEALDDVLEEVRTTLFPYHDLPP